MKPTLLVLAAGMGSRYGGLKQLDCVGPNGETIMDYSVYDAVRAGFGKVVFVIRHDFEKEFNERVLSRYKDFVPVEVVFQSIDALPEGYSAPAGRTKPWGTNHAIMMGAKAINEPFAVINADDFYGSDAFRVIGEYLSGLKEDDKGQYCMVAFKLGNTMTENGSVSRGVCTVDDHGMMTSVVERSKIAFEPEGSIMYTDGETGEKHILEADAPVSMNFWGLTPEYFDYSEALFREFLDKHGQEEKSEFYIPSCVDALVHSGKATVRVLGTDSKWFGVTYAQDRQGVCDNLARLHAEGEYPKDGLWK